MNNHGRNHIGRRRSGRVLTFQQLEPRIVLSHSPVEHIHANLTILLEGNQVAIPANIGLSTTGHFNPHTHDENPDPAILESDGELHIGEGGPPGLGNELRLARLEDFFDIWRERGGFGGNNPSAFFDQDRILNRITDATHVVRMFVNDQLNSEFEQYTPHDGDEIVIRYDALPATPSGLTFATTSDSGFRNDDRFTNRDQWQVQVGGVTPGATVAMRSGGTTVGQVLASGTSVDISVNASGLSDGSHDLTVVQIVDGLSSTASGTLQVTLDRTAPEILSELRSALAGQQWTFDVQANEEGDPGFSYSLTSRPAGMDLVSSSTGALSWSPDTTAIGRHEAVLQTTDGAGNSREHSLAVFVVDPIRPWQNPVNRLDVDADGLVVPIDALIIINRLNAGTTGIFPAPTANESSPPFYDTTGDNSLAPIDVLQVINFLISESGNGEGESATWPTLFVLPSDDTIQLLALVDASDEQGMPMQPSASLAINQHFASAAVQTKDNRTSSSTRFLQDNDTDDLLELLARDWHTKTARDEFRVSE